MILFLQPKDYAGEWPVRRSTLRRDFARVIATLCEWRRRRRSRGALARLDDRSLRDIGVTRCEAANEIAKPFWRE